jgi:hypothetical protein
MEQEYGHIKLPIEFIEQINVYMEQHKPEGFTTRVEVVKTALREFFKNGSTNYQPLSGEESKLQGGKKHEQMAEGTPTQPDNTGLDNAQGELHRADEKRVEDPTGKAGKIESMGGEDDPTS